MSPEPPMSLRLSSALLLGVVRIYSKKLDFLFHDYNLLNTLLAKAFVSIQVDLPENARIAPIESVTLLQSLNLDYFHLEDDDILERRFDNNLANEEDITLTDQILTGIDPYVAITFDEDMIPESCPMDIDQYTVPVDGLDVEMAYEAGPNNVALDTGTYGPRNDTEEIFEFFHDHRPSNLAETLNANSPGSVPEIEKRRNATHDLSPRFHPPFATQQHNVRIERPESLNENINEKEHTIPIIDEFVVGRFFQVLLVLRKNVQIMCIIHHLNWFFSQLLLLSHHKQGQGRGSILIRIMKQRLEDPSDILRNRNKIPSSKLDIWILINNHQSKKDQLFNEPLFTGFSNVLRSVFEKDCVTSKPYLVVSENVQDFTVPQSAETGAQSPQRFHNDGIRIKRLRDGGDFSSYIMSSPVITSLKS